MRRLPLAVLLTLLLVGPTRAPGAWAEDRAPAGARTAHYEIASDGPRAEAEEWGLVLEAAWPQFRAFFGGEPALRDGARLSLIVTQDAGAWTEAIRSAGGSPPGPTSGAGGYYDPVSRGAYLFRQPTVWYTRTLLLHEAAHQFHYLAATSNRAPPAVWYVEGVAEHLSHHTWDGTRLRLGVVPLLSLEDRPAKALEAVAAPTFALAPLVSGESSPRPESMHLVRFLLEGEQGQYRKRFRSLAEKLDHGGSAKALFARTFGAEEPLLEAWRRWLPEAQQPWVPIHVEWEARGERALRGRSGVVSVCRVRGPTQRVATTWSAPDGPWRAGALLHFTSMEDWSVGLVDGSTVRVHRRTKTGWEFLPAALPPPPAAGRPWSLVAERAGSRVTLTVNGARVGAWDLPGDALGLALDACQIDFRDLEWR